MESGYSPFKGMGDQIRLSEMTIRTAMSRKPVTYQTAASIGNKFSIPIECFRIKVDNRGKSAIRRKKGS
jgi:hypothetical protein